MGEVLKRNGGFSLRYYDGSGKRVVRASGQPTLAAARRLLAQIEARIALGLHGVETASTLTVAELCEQFLTSGHPKVKDAAAYRRAARYSLVRVLPLLGHLPLSKLRRRDIEAARDRLSQRLKPNSVRAVLRPLAAALTWAVRQELLSQSPMQKLELPRRDASTEHLSLEESGRLLATAEAAARRGTSTDWCRYLAIALALRLGLRRGELFGLRWVDIDIANRRLTVARSYEGLPKNGKPRTLPIPSQLAALLREWQSRCPRGELVCPLSKRLQTSTLKPLLQAAKCQPLRRGWHSLRHTFASIFVSQGGSMLTLRELLGHASLEQSLIYSHIAPEALVSDIEKIKI